MKNVTFYEKNVIDSSATFACTTADETTAENAFDGDRNTKLISSGSTNGNPEVFEITFASHVSFNRIFIGGHNILNGEVLYDSGSGYTAFSVQVKLSQNSETSNYFEFDTVSSVDSIKIIIDTCIGYADEKYISEIIAFTELGTFSKNPVSYSMPVFEEDSRVHELSDGGNFKVIFGSKFHSTLSFNNMTTADMTLTRLIKDRIDPFYVYPYPNPTIPDPIGGSTIDFIFFDGYTSAIGFLATNLPADYTSMTDGSEVTISGTKINGTFTLTSDMISETDGSSAFQIRYWKILFDCADPDMCCACDPILPATFVASSWNALGGLDTDFYGLAKESVVLETWAWVSGSIDKMTYLATGSASPDAPADGYSWNTITSFSGSSSGNIFIVADNLRDHSVSLVPDSIQTYPEQDQAPFRSKDIFYVEYINNPEPRIYDDQIMGVGTIIDIELGEV